MLHHYYPISSSININNPTVTYYSRQLHQFDWFSFNHQNHNSSKKFTNFPSASTCYQIVTSPLLLLTPLPTSSFSSLWNNFITTQPIHLFLYQHFQPHLWLNQTVLYKHHCCCVLIWDNRRQSQRKKWANN